MGRNPAWVYIKYLRGLLGISYVDFVNIFDFLDLGVEKCDFDGSEIIMCYNNLHFYI